MKRKTCKACSVKLPEGLKPWVTWCSEDCGTKLAMKNLERDARNRERALGRERREFKAKVRGNDLSLQKRLTQADFNAMIRELDKDQGCISCDKPASWSGQWHASHYKTTAAMPAIRYDARNCFKACSVCNNYLSGNLGAYREALEKKYGIALIDWLEDAHVSRKLTCEELISMRKEFAAETRRLKKGLPPSRNWRELPPMESGQKA